MGSKLYPKCPLTTPIQSPLQCIFFHSKPIPQLQHRRFLDIGRQISAFLTLDHRHSTYSGMYVLIPWWRQKEPQRSSVTHFTEMYLEPAHYTEASGLRQTEPQAHPRQSFLLVEAMVATCDNEHFSRNLFFSPTFKSPLQLFFNGSLFSLFKVSHHVVHVFLSCRCSSFSIHVLRPWENASPLILPHTPARSQCLLSLSNCLHCKIYFLDQLKLQTFPPTSSRVWTNTFH